MRRFDGVAAMARRGGSTAALGGGSASGQRQRGLNVEQVEREHGGEDAGERGRGESSQSRMTPRVGVGATICASGASRTSEEALRW